MQDMADRGLRKSEPSILQVITSNIFTKEHWLQQPLLPKITFVLYVLSLSCASFVIRRSRVRIPQSFTVSECIPNDKEVEDRFACQGNRVRDKLGTRKTPICPWHTCRCPTGRRNLKCCRYHLAEIPQKVLFIDHDWTETPCFTGHCIEILKGFDVATLSPINKGASNKNYINLSNMTFLINF